MCLVEPNALVLLYICTKPSTLSFHDRCLPEPPPPPLPIHSKDPYHGTYRPKTWTLTLKLLKKYSAHPKLVTAAELEIGKWPQKGECKATPHTPCNFLCLEVHCTYNLPRNCSYIPIISRVTVDMGLIIRL